MATYPAQAHTRAAMRPSVPRAGVQRVRDAGALTPRRSSLHRPQPVPRLECAAKNDEASITANGTDVLELVVASDDDLRGDSNSQAKMLVPNFATAQRGTSLATTKQPNTQLQTAAMRGLQAENSMLSAQLTQQNKDVQEQKVVIKQQQRELLALRSQLNLQKGEARALRAALQDAQQVLATKEEQVASISSLLLEGSRERNQLRSQLLAAQADTAAAVDQLASFTEDLMALKTVMDSVDDLEGDLGIQVDSSAAQDQLAAGYSGRTTNGNGRHNGSSSNGSKASNGNGSSSGGGWMSSKFLQSLGLRQEAEPEAQPRSQGNGSSSYGDKASGDVDIMASDDDLDEASLAMLAELVELAKSLAGDASRDLEAAQLASSATSGMQRMSYSDEGEVEADIAGEVEAEASEDMM